MGSGSVAFDVIVIGGGVMGSSTAYETAKRGQKTLLLEQFDFLHSLGSSHGESRTIRATYAKDYYTQMVIESSKLWREVESEAGYKVYSSTNQLNVGPADNAGLRAVIASCQRNSIPYEKFERHEFTHKFSGRVGIPENWTAVYTELGGVIKPTKAVSMFQALAFQKGAILRDNMEVNDIRRDEERGGVLVSTTKGDKFWGRKCVITAGAWTNKLVNSVAGLELPIQPLEITVCYWRIKDGHEEKYTIEGDFPTFSSYGHLHIYGTPSLEYPGMIKILIHGGPPCDPDQRSWRQPDSSDMDSLKEWIERTFLGQVDCSAPVFTQSCMYSMTPDEDFVMDFLGGEFGEDVVIGGGFSGHGFKMAPVIGRTLAELALTGHAQGIELEHFRMARFRGNPKGNETT